MLIGTGMFFTDYSITPTELGVALETRGFESLWAPEHSHIPLSRESSFAGWNEIPKKYFDVMDPFVTLTAAAAATTTLKLGTGICLVVQRDPIQTAKLVASIDRISDGRFLFGVGNGWNAEEMADHGTDFKLRHAVARERIDAMKKIWTEDVCEYHGDFVDFPPMTSRPKPTQTPHPPVIVGGSFPYGARRAIAYGDGWMPHATLPPYEDVTDHLPEFRRLAEEAGRAAESLPVTVWGGNPDLDRLKLWRDRGVTRAVIPLESLSADELMPEIDRWAEWNLQLNS